MDEWRAGRRLLGRIVSACVGLTWLAACGGDQARVPGVASRELLPDDTWVARPAIPEPPSPDDQWTLAPEPVLVLGSVEEEGPELFQSVDQVLLLRGGGVAIVDRDPPRIELFERDGSHRVTVGRYGRGPGEFVRPPAIIEVGQDTILAWDPALRRLTRFGPDGRVTEVRTLDGDVGQFLPLIYSPGAWSLTSMGDVVVQAAGVARHCNCAIGVLGQETPITYRVWPPIDTTMTPPMGPSHVRHLASSSFIDWGRVVVGGDVPSVYVSDPSAWQIDVHSLDGALQGSIQPRVPRQAVTPELLSAARDSTLDRTTGALRERTEAYDRLHHPDSVAAIGALEWDRSGYLWVGRLRPYPQKAPLRYEIFRPDGTWAGWFSRTDSVGFIRDIAYGRIAFRVRDEMGVPFVRVYELRAPSER